VIFGQPTTRGIRQADFLSPYIFVMVMEFFSIQMDIFIAVCKIKPLRRRGQRGDVITHLLFADDMLIFTKNMVSSLKDVNNLLELLSTNTGLSTNKGKSKIFFSKGTQKEKSLRSAIGIGEGKLPTKYLGIPLSINYLKAKDYSSLIDKCRGNIEGWMANTLSFAGRVELIITVCLALCNIGLNPSNCLALLSKLWRVCLGSSCGELNCMYGHEKKCVPQNVKEA